MAKMIEPIRIEIPLGIMFQTVNCYLVPGEILTLIDCGLYSEDNWGIFQKAIKESGYQVNDIEQIIITHEHRDHIGLLPEIMESSQARVRAPRMIRDWFSQPEEMTRKEILFNKKLLSHVGFQPAQLAQAYKFLEARVVDRPIEKMERIHFFEEGESLRFGDTDWEVLHTPGHCLAQHVFLQKEQGRIFGSDMLLPVAPMPIPTDNVGDSETEKGALHLLLDSFERLKVFDIQQVYPGHGKEFPQANHAIQRQLARIQIRKEECFEAIKSGLRTPSQLREKMYPYQNTPPDFSGLFMVLGYLQLLKYEGRIVEKVGLEMPRSFWINA